MPVKVFSYGGGVQSFACLILAAQGLLDFKTFVFCNVGADSENPKSLEHVEQVAKPFAKAHGLEFVELHKVLRTGEIDTVYKRLTRHGSRSIGIPVRMNKNGAPGRRACTYDFKIAVVDKELRARGGKKDGSIVGIGISLDEIQRVKPNLDKKTMAWKVNHFPLIMDLNRPYTRQNCINVIEKAGLPVPPKSACIFCPFHKLQDWQEMRQHEPQQFWYCVNLERFLNERSKTLGREPVWLSSKLKPLDEFTYDREKEVEVDEMQWSCDSGYCFV